MSVASAIENSLVTCLLNRIRDLILKNKTQGWDQHTVEAKLLVAIEKLESYTMLNIYLSGFNCLLAEK